MLEIKPVQRSFLPASFTISSWKDVQPYVDDLLERPLDSLKAFQKFLEDESELDGVVSEDHYWCYIKMTCNTADKELKASYDDFLENILPPLMQASEKLSRRLAESPYAADIKDAGFSILLRGARKTIELFREANIPLAVEDGQKSNQSGQIRGAMMVELDGKTMTMQQAGDRLYWTDREKREEAWRAMRSRFYQDTEKFDTLFDELVKIRHQIARNAGFDNFRDYQFRSLGRYDYTAEDCLEFHDAIEQAIMPLVREIQETQAAKLGLAKLRPWDGAVDPDNKPPLKAFESAADLIEKGRVALGKVDPLFGEIVRVMNEKGRFDIDSRPNKRPGGYMCDMPETVIPFVFANVTETVSDLTTFVHEMGHATHNILMQDLRLNGYRRYPIEVAELASMAMELLSFDQWHIFFPDEADCRRAKCDHLKGIIGFFPWMAQVDAFQHEIYIKPDLSPHDRHKIFSWVQQRFSTGMVDWEGFADWHEAQWQKQGHIFENPFYYIEYGIAQLGALQLWRNYKRDPQKTLEQYKAALALGYTKSIPEIYETAGIKFDFSAEMLKDLMAFVQEELRALE